MIYNVDFIGANGKAYNVQMAAQDGSDEVKQLTLVAGGCVVSFANDDDVFKPLRSSSASITVLTDADLSNLYSVGAQDVPVVIKEDGAVVFRGFVEPLQLSQPLSSRATELTIECVDALSTLKHFDFAEWGTPLPTMRAYFERALALASPNATLSLQVVESYDRSTDEMAVNAGNWFDEDGEPSNWASVLVEILRYLNMTMMQRGGEVLVCDARHLVDGEVAELDDLTFSGGSISRSLTEVYNRVKVSVSLYSDTAAIPAIFDNDTAEAVGPAEANNIVYTYDSDTLAQDYFTFYKQSGVETKRYDGDNDAWVDSSGATAIADTKGYPGAYLVKSSTIKWPSDRGLEYYKDVIVSDHDDRSVLLINCANSLLTGADEDIVDTVDTWDVKWLIKLHDDAWRVFAGDYTLVLSGKVSYTPELDYTQSAMLPTKLNDLEYFKMFLMACSRYGYPDADEVNILSKSSYIIMRLKIGDKYWVNKNENNLDALAAGTWSTTPGNFYAYVALDDNVRCHTDLYGEKEIKDDGTIKRYGAREGEWLNSKSFIIRNNVRWTDNISGRGLRIPISAADKLAGKIELEISIPWSPMQGCVQYVMLEDLKLELSRAPQSGTSMATARLDEDSDDDVVYENIIDDASARDAEEIVLKVATDVGRKYSRGAVVLVGSSYNYAGELVSNLTGTKLIAEKHLIEARVAQYKEPRQMLDGTIRNYIVDWTRGMASTDLGKKYMVAGATINYDNSQSKVKLIEIG